MLGSQGINLKNVWLQLSKARLSALVVVTTAAGFLFAYTGRFDLKLFTFAMAGTFLSAAGINAFNQWAERGRDALMHRTRNRPLPSNLITPSAALWFGILVSLLGDVVLLLWVNPLTAALSLLTQVLYVAVYTPLKTRNPLCTLVGAVCGAIPPMMGWTAAVGSIGTGAWILASLLFVWQVPHFLSLAWLYREDYGRGGYKMLPNVEKDGQQTFQMLLLYTIALLPISFSLKTSGLAGWTAAVAVMLLSAFLLVLSYRLYHFRTLRLAKAVFVASIVYLPLVLAFAVADKEPAAKQASPQIAARPDAASAQIDP